jgi:hypothetical protein
MGVGTPVAVVSHTSRSAGLGRIVAIITTIIEGCEIVWPAPIGSGMSMSIATRLICGAGTSYTPL